LRGFTSRHCAVAKTSVALSTKSSRRAPAAQEYRELLPTEDDREAFDGLVKLARTVYPYVEDHNFFVEHWHHSLFWEKVRELGEVFVAHKFFDDKEDIFYLHRHEVYDALYDMIG
jgi:pyruvate,water dikinase